jgi:hypothetical protein
VEDKTHPTMQKNVAVHHLRVAHPTLLQHVKEHGHTEHVAKEDELLLEIDACLADRCQKLHGIHL